MLFSWATPTGTMVTFPPSAPLPWAATARPVHQPGFRWARASAWWTTRLRQFTKCWDGSATRPKTSRRSRPRPLQCLPHFAHGLPRDPSNMRVILRENHLSNFSIQPLQPVLYSLDSEADSHL